MAVSMDFNHLLENSKVSIDQATEKQLLSKMEGIFHDN